MHDLASVACAMIVKCEFSNLWCGICYIKYKWEIQISDQAMTSVERNTLAMAVCAAMIHFVEGGRYGNCMRITIKKEASFERIVLQLLHARWLRNLCIVGF